MTESKPLMAQYAAIKAEYKDAVLLYQMGDFFECFYEDAEKVSEVLGLVLTSRSKDKTNAPPMAGFPQKALDDYLPKLIAAGVKVAVARQMENPKNAKGIVKRAVTEVITQGTIATQEELLSKDKNYIGWFIPMANSLESPLQIFLQVSLRFTRGRLKKRPN
jgi:DNA mismatch repair protein MutS